MTRRLALSLTVAAVAITALIAGGSWYHRNIGWPNDIQQRLTGFTPLGYADLQSAMIDFSQFGEGFARWRYAASALDSAERSRICAPQPPDCSIAKSARIEEGVTIFLYANASTVTIEEWWD